MNGEMKTFVYYEDDYPDNGGIGLEQFDSIGGAEAFIIQRMKSGDKRELGHYRVIVGREWKICPVTVVTRFEIKEEV